MTALKEITSSLQKIQLRNLEKIPETLPIWLGIEACNFQATCYFEQTISFYSRILYPQFSASFLFGYCFVCVLNWIFQSITSAEDTSV